MQILISLLKNYPFKWMQGASHLTSITIEKVEYYILVYLPKYVKNR